MARQPRLSPEDDAFVGHDIQERIIKEKEALGKRPSKKEIIRSTVKGERNFYILFGVIVAVLILLIFGYRFVVGKPEMKTIDELHSENLAGQLDPEEGYVYDGFSFVNVDGQWWTRFQRANSSDVYNVQLRYGPRDLQDVPLSGDYVYFLHFNASFVTFDPLGENLSHVVLAASDISQSMVKVFGIATFPACTRQDNNSCKSLPIIGCVPGRPVIYLKQEAIPFVETKGTCIIIHGSGFDMVKAVDRLLLAWYGIMP